MKLSQKTLDAVANRLFEGGLNYTVFLQLYPVSTVQKDSVAYIREALGPSIVLDRIELVDADVVRKEVKTSLLFAGDASAGPSPTVLDSSEFLTLLAEVDVGLRELIGRSLKVERFSLREGHPTYPVFWDFAFLFSQAQTASVLVGSSSD